MLLGVKLTLLFLLMFSNNIFQTAPPPFKEGGIDAQCSGTPVGRSLTDAPSWTIISMYEEGAMPLQITGSTLARRGEGDREMPSYKKRNFHG